ncbi:MAG: NAD(P)H-hydrate epimerase, partial [Acidobacteriota bacterium]
MIPVLDSAQMRAADRITIEELGLPGLVLMEMAAAGVTDALLERCGEARRVVVACGPGNNGGDGLAVARQLMSRGLAAVEVWLLVEERALSGDAAVQLGLARAFGVPVQVAGAELDTFGRAVDGAEVVVDALFGTGLDRPLSGRMAEAVARINSCGAVVVAVDVPSGVSGSSAEPPGESIEAALTVTFAAPKVAHVLPPACLRCGEVAVADIGIPHWVLERQARLHLLEGEDVAAWLPPR